MPLAARPETSMRNASPTILLERCSKRDKTGAGNASASRRLEAQLLVDEGGNYSRETEEAIGARLAE
jgi:hypothetical protein